MTSRLIFAFAALSLTACHDHTGIGDIDPERCPSYVNTTPGSSPVMPILGCGAVVTRYTAEIAVRGSLAYTTTWGRRQAPGNQINVWDVSGDKPALIDTVTVGGNVTTTGDVAVSDDGRWLVVPTEYCDGSLALFDLANPRHPVPGARYSTSETSYGVHTAEVGRVNGKLYSFLSADPGASGCTGTAQSRMLIVDLSNPASPQTVFSKQVGSPFVHDSFVRDGILFLALWNNGVEIWDLGGGGHGGTPSAPIVLGGVRTVNGDAHNIWWFHDPSAVANGNRYAFVGEEGPGAFGTNSSGDIHVLDVSDLTQAREVAIYHVDGAGTHNFSVDEPRGILYAAYYNAGIRAIDVRGDLGTCTAAQQTVVASATLCDLRKMGREMAVGLNSGSMPVYVWGVQYLADAVYASDMLNGIWKLRAVSR
jgi:hypothetical protein